MAIEKSVIEKKNSPLYFKEWRRILWQLFRPHTLTASFIPVLIGTAYSWLTTKSLQPGLLIAMLIASILIQAATNMFNEYFDYKRGLDTSDSVGIAGAITRDGIKAKTVLYIAIGCFALATLLGVYICANSSWWLAVIGSCCMAVGYFYTAGPFPIAYTPLGELVSGLVMGTGIILIAYFIQTGSISWNVLLISIPSLILVGAIMMSNNIRDREGDKLGGRHTLAILLGQEKAVLFMAGMFIFSYLWIIILILLDILSPWCLLTLVSIPKAVKGITGFQGKKHPGEMMGGMKQVAQTNTLFGFLFILGLIVDIMTKQA